jgi:hypothetical protein
MRHHRWSQSSTARNSCGGSSSRQRCARCELVVQPAHNMDRAERAYCRRQPAHGEHNQGIHRFPPMFRDDLSDAMPTVRNSLPSFVRVIPTTVG